MTCLKQTQRAPQPKGTENGGTRDLLYENNTQVHMEEKRQKTRLGYKERNKPGKEYKAAPDMVWNTVTTSPTDAASMPPPLE
jgi:hypothetical protein